MKSKLNKATFWLYIIVYLFCMARYFIFRRGFGNGLGDLFFIILFTLYFILQFIAFIKGKNKVVLTLVSILNIIGSITILLKIYVYYGSEVSYEWKHGVWNW
jgi:hypothetical protein